MKCDCNGKGGYFSSIPMMGYGRAWIRCICAIEKKEKEELKRLMAKYPDECNT